MGMKDGTAARHDPSARTGASPRMAAPSAIVSPNIVTFGAASLEKPSMMRTFTALLSASSIEVPSNCAPVTVFLCTENSDV